MHSFYSDLRYRQKQSAISKTNWRKGIYAKKIKPFETRNCKNGNCPNSFWVKPRDPKIFCSKNCATSFNNAKRLQTEETKRKISLALQGFHSPLKGLKKVKRITKVCLCCKKEFTILPYVASKRKYCSNKCAIYTIGRLTTSPKASKGKPGIRLDINSSICFYSTWEANIARVFNLVGVTWQYGPKIFDLGQHTYRPDFYLPIEDLYIEVKNFMNNYSLERDKLFRKKFPKIKLEILSKVEYKEIEANYKPLIDFWEN
ncbi:MAG: NUMOD3 domain-containing DNA-binding protein [Candidatus Levyibacteriota bacterium]|jgi:hypothetical protein